MSNYFTFCIGFVIIFTVFPTIYIESHRNFSVSTEMRQTKTNMSYTKHVTHFRYFWTLTFLLKKNYHVCVCAPVAKTITALVNWKPFAFFDKTMKMKFSYTRFKPCAHFVKCWIFFCCVVNTTFFFIVVFVGTCIWVNFG